MPRTDDDNSWLDHPGVQIPVSGGVLVFRHNDDLEREKRRESEEQHNKLQNLPNAANDQEKKKERARMSQEEIERELIRRFAERANEVVQERSLSGSPAHGRSRAPVSIRMDPENVKFLKWVGPRHTSLINGFVSALREAFERVDLYSPQENEPASESSQIDSQPS